MSAITVLTAVEAANAVLTLGINAMLAAQRINELLSKAHAEGRDITAEEWENIIGEADVADKRLAEAIRTTI